MKYRLKSDHTKTMEATPSSLNSGGYFWVRVTFVDHTGQRNVFSAPESFLLDGGWEPVDEEKPEEGGEVDFEFRVRIQGPPRSPGSMTASLYVPEEILNDHRFLVACSLMNLSNALRAELLVTVKDPPEAG